jgi:hypothetical protein
MLGNDLSTKSNEVYYENENNEEVLLGLLSDL